MRIIYRSKFRLFLLISALTLLLVFTSCGAKNSATSSSGSATTPTGVATPRSTPTATADQAAGTGHGCPSNAVVNAAPATVNITMQATDGDKAVTVHKGDVIDVRFPFGFHWNGPTTSQGGLHLQQPYGYELKSDQVCVWRFTATDTGTTQLNFSNRALCKAGQLCPMFVRALPITVTVQ